MGNADQNVDGRTQRDGQPVLYLPGSSRSTTTGGQTQGRTVPCSKRAQHAKTPHHLTCAFVLSPPILAPRQHPSQCFGSLLLFSSLIPRPRDPPTRLAMFGFSSHVLVPHPPYARYASTPRNATGMLYHPPFPRQANTPRNGWFSLSMYRRSSPMTR